MCPPAPGDRRREHAWAVAGTPGNSRPSAARSGTAGAESFRAASGAERQTPTRRSPGPTNAPLRSAQSPWARLRPALASRPPLPTLPSGRGSGPGSGPCGGGSRPREAAVRPFPPVALPSPLGRSRHCTPGLPISSPRLPPTPGERAGPLLPATQRRVCVNPRPLPAGRSCRPHAESVLPPPPPGRCAPFRSRQPRRGLSRLSGAALRAGSRGEEGGHPPAALPRSELHPLAALPPSPGTVRHRGDTRRLIGRGSRAELRRATPCLGQPSAAVCFVIKSIKLLLSSETEAGGGGVTQRKRGHSFGTVSAKRRAPPVGGKLSWPTETPPCTRAISVFYCISCCVASLCVTLRCFIAARPLGRSLLALRGFTSVFNAG